MVFTSYQKLRYATQQAKERRSWLPDVGSDRLWVSCLVLMLAVLAFAGCSETGQETPSTEVEASETEQPAQSDTASSAEELPDDSNTENPDTNGASEDASNSSSTDSENPTEDLFPDVIAVDATQDADGTWTFAVTMSSPYDGPDRYADAWRVEGPDGEVFGIRELAHDHASEQPFTRSQSGIEIPDDVVEVTVAGRDQQNGWGGQALIVKLG